MDVETVEHCVDGLAYLFTESAKYVDFWPSPCLLLAYRAVHRTRITEIDFLDSLMLLSFPQELSDKLKEVREPSSLTH